MKKLAVAIRDFALDFLPVQPMYEIIVFDEGKISRREYKNSLEAMEKLSEISRSGKDFDYNRFYRIFGYEYRRENITSRPKVKRGGR